MNSVKDKKLFHDKDMEEGLLGIKPFQTTIVSNRASQWENLHVDNRAERVQADLIGLIVDLNYNIRIIHD